MGRSAIQPSQALAGLIRSRRRELGLSLREVQQQTEQLGHPIPFTTLAKVEQGQVDPGVKRLHLLLRLYHLPVQLAADLLDLEQFANGEPDPTLTPRRLYDDGVAHWRAGRLRDGLGHLLALRSKVPTTTAARHERQRALLMFAIAAGSMGKFRISHEIVQGLLFEPPEPDLRVPVFIQAAVCWHWLGSAEAALAFLVQAESHIDEHDHKQRAWVLHERAGTLLSLGHLDDAEAALRSALEHYAIAGEPYDESRALGVLVRLALERKDPREALRAAVHAREHAERHGFMRLKIMRRMDEGRALAALGDGEGGLSALKEALGQAIASQDGVLEFYGHHALWKTHAALGDHGRAEHELRAAQFHVRAVDETTPEANEVRATIKPRRRRTRSVTPAAGRTPSS